MANNDVVLADILEKVADPQFDPTPSKSMHQELMAEIRSRFSRIRENRPASFTVDLGPNLNFKFPYTQMGAIDVLDLFNLDELILFDAYRKRSRMLKKVADIGANVGVHSTVLGRLGFSVRAYEPDPQHAEVLRATLQMNNCSSVELFEAAVGEKRGRAKFVRVLGNTTSSHLLGAKSNAYGQLDTFEVEVVEFPPILRWADMVKMDVEGLEAQLVHWTDAEDWKEVEVFAEIGTSENASKIFEHASKIGVQIFPQKTAWRAARSVGDLPSHYSQGLVRMRHGDADENPVACPN